MDHDAKAARHADDPASPPRHELPSDSELAAAIERGDARRAMALVDASYGAALYRFIRAMVVPYRRYLPSLADPPRVRAPATRSERD